jgi:outer membrane protein assembly factor BamD (BamD/ComL family)
LASFILLLFCACSGTNLYQHATISLVEAEKLLETGKDQESEVRQALAILDAIKIQRLDEIDQQRYLIDLATAHFMLQEYWDTFATLKNFPRDYPSSNYLPKAEDLEFNAGARIAERGKNILGIWRDLDDTVSILEHFLLFYPTSNYIPDALRILGEAAWLDKKYDLVIDRFGELLEKDPRGIWRELATFRIAMAHFYQLTGPSYDLEALEAAKRELVGFLRTAIQNPKFQKTARKALAVTLNWIDEKNLQIADFYIRVFKPKSAVVYLKKILRRLDSKFRDQALNRLRKLGLRDSVDPKETR